MIRKETDQEAIVQLLTQLASQPETIKKLTVSVSDEENLIHNPKLTLISSDVFPKAIEEVFIHNEDSKYQRANRAKAICELFIKQYVNKEILDFGCGDGSVVNYLNGKCRRVCGYDIKQNKYWESNLLFNSWEKVNEFAPFDLVIMFDVIDHCESEEEANNCLSKVSDVLDDDGVILCRCHPWLSRHGAHLHKSLNKAFVHLLLNDNDYRMLDIIPEQVLKLSNPLNSYLNWFANNDLLVDSMEIKNDPVDYFFVENYYQEFMEVLESNHWSKLSNSFIDFRIKKMTFV